MRVLQVVQKCFDAMGLSPKRDQFNPITSIILVLATSGVGLQWIFFFHEADSSQEYMESIYVATACSGALISFASTVFIRKQLFSFIGSVDELFNGRLERPTEKVECEKTNHLVEKYSEIGVFAMKNVIAPSFVLPKAIYSFFVYFTSDLGNDALNLPLPAWSPFDLKYPVRYLMAVSAQLLWAVYLFQYFGCFVFLAFGTFMFAVSSVKDVKRQLHSINKMARDKKPDASKPEKMYKKMSALIRGHANSKQTYDLFSNLYEITLTDLFVGSIITIISVMLLVQIEISHDKADSLVLLEAAVFGVCAHMLILFVCEIGQRFSNVIEEIDARASRLRWYLFPIEIQRILPTFFLNTQKPAVIKCFGNVLCDRNQFVKVLKAACSYFIVLREFYK